MKDIEHLAEQGAIAPARNMDADARDLPAAIMHGDHRPDLIRDEVLCELFRATALSSPDAVALSGPDVTLSYAQVDADSNRIAAGLIEAGIGPGDIVGLWMPRGIPLLVAQIAITKTGAAWLPFDADAPLDRIAVCLADCEAKALVCDEAFRARAIAHVMCPVHADTMLGARDEADFVDPRARGLTPDHPAYLIYTSGSTGVPKGIVITHRNICHFLRSANAVYGIGPQDVMFQGASVAFDLSMEEIWIPYLVGARLFVASGQMLGDVENLPATLTKAGVTVLDTVPTLLAMLGEDVPGLRLILLGGEALPAPLVTRWWREGRRMLNTYGPTEATVVATVAEVRSGETVTIGRPIPNYTAMICDEALSPLPPGTQGELVIGGPGIARGYWKRPELTADKFVGSPPVYRSGDAVSLDPAGNILFHGRIDDQVKIRGFRVELGEIEARMSHEPSVAQAAVALRQDDGIDRLVAFVVPKPDGAFDRRKLRASLREQMPAYMVPQHIELVAFLPRLSSGKVDRKRLKALPLTAAQEAEPQDEPRTANERALLDAARGVFGNQSLPLEADFFTDLGGHSLIAARFVSAVRENPDLAGITLQDVYGARTLRAMGRLLEDKGFNVGSGTAARDLSFAPPPLSRRFLCGLGQALALPVILALVTAQWLGIFVSFLLIAGEDYTLPMQLLLLAGAYLGITLGTGLIAVAMKWIVLGRTKPGRYPLWGAYYFRWWLAQKFSLLIHVKWLQGSPAMRVYLRLLGARIGRDVLISDIDIGAVDLLSIGDGTSLGGKVKIANAEAIGNEFIIGAVEIGRDCYIGTSCVIGHDVSIGDHAELADLTAIPEHTRIGPAESWDGSPGRKVGLANLAGLPAHATASRRRRIANNIFYALVLGIVPAVSLLPIFPAFYLFDQIDDVISNYTEISYLWYLPLLTWPTSIGLVFFTVGLIALFRWAVLPRVRGGTWSVHSPFYLRKWTVSLATEVTLDTLSSLFATVYMRAWYRLMGAGIGKGSEISTNLAGRYDITDVGAKNFIADEVVLGDEDVRRGYMTLAPVRTGDQVFVGNDAVVPPGATIPDGVLIGIKSKPPANEVLQPGDTWFGSPPIKLPTRQKFDGVAANWTYEPTIWRKLGRAVFEALHTSFPGMLTITCGLVAVELLLQPMIEQGRWTELLLGFIAASVVIAIAQTLMVAVMKWLMMGTYKPTMKPMWSWWAMRTEAVAVLYWGLGGKVLLEHLRGTPFLPWMLWFFGARFGKGVWMNTTDITEFDCIDVGDYCVINSMSALQTHLYEDRVMKVGRVKLGTGVSVGAGATVLYDTHVGDYAQLGGLTVVMKGENIPSNSQWHGAPAVPVAPPQPSAAPREMSRAAA